MTFVLLQPYDNTHHQSDLTSRFMWFAVRQQDLFLFSAHAEGKKHMMK